MMAVRWARVPEVVADLEVHPDSYTPWFKLSFEGFLKSPASRRYL